MVGVRSSTMPTAIISSMMATISSFGSCASGPSIAAISSGSWARVIMYADTVAAAQRNITDAVVRLARVSTSTSPAQVSSRYSRVETASA